MSHEFAKDCIRRAEEGARKWYHHRLMGVLLQAKEKRTRDIDVSIELANQLLEILNSPAPKATPVTPRQVETSNEVNIMRPVEPELMDILLKGRESGATERYLHERYKKAPEDKFYFREASNWDYGWQQKQSRMRARDAHHGKLAVLRDTFYRTRNIAPDPPHYGQPAVGDTNICGEYQCNFS